VFFICIDTDEPVDSANNSHFVGWFSVIAFGSDMNITPASADPEDQKQIPSTNAIERNKTIIVFLSFEKTIYKNARDTTRIAGPETPSDGMLQD
jgi:hypothetical protein